MVFYKVWVRAIRSSHSSWQTCTYNGSSERTWTQFNYPLIKDIKIYPTVDEVITSVKTKFFKKSMTHSNKREENNNWRFLKHFDAFSSFGWNERTFKFVLIVWNFFSTCYPIQNINMYQCIGYIFTFILVFCSSNCTYHKAVI